LLMGEVPLYELCSFVSFLRWEWAVQGYLAHKNPPPLP